MLNKEYRLTRRNHFAFVYRKGKSAPAKNMVLVFVKNKKENQIKIGFSVSKKIGKSVTRNKIKRQLREAFRYYLPNVQKGYSYVIIARPEIGADTYQDIKRSMLYVLQKSGNYIEKTE